MTYMSSLHITEREKKRKKEKRREKTTTTRKATKNDNKKEVNMYFGEMKNKYRLV